MRKIIAISLLFVFSAATVYAQNKELDRSQIPHPVFDKNEEFIQLYWKTWQLAWDHVKHQENVPQSPYMDEAFSDSWIWIWDTCFMLHFCKYAPTLFPGIESLDNFYRPMHNGEKTSAAIHILDNPPLFAWTELEYFKFTNDTARISKLLFKDQYLQKHFEWFETVKPGFKLKNVKHYGVCLSKDTDGYHWEGGRSGMDNTPRGRRGEKAKKDRPNNPRMLWIDAIAQQGLSAKSISQLAQLSGDKQMAKKWRAIYKNITKKVNKLYWNKNDRFYYDIDSEDRSHFKCMTLASYWPLLAQMSSKKQARAMSSHVEDDNKFGGASPWVTLARDDKDFDPITGNYWRGSVWLPTAYMGIKAIEKYGHHQLANQTAYTLLEQMNATYKLYSPHTIWECYSPNSPTPAKHGKNRVRPDFCGWSALGPISIFIENVIGFNKVDAQNNCVNWNLHHKERNGIKGLRFGTTITDIVYDNGLINVQSNNNYTLIVNGKRFKVVNGSNQFRFQL